MGKKIEKNSVGKGIENISRNIETISMLRKRKFKFIKKETLHTLNISDEGNKIPIEIVSQQHSLNGKINIFIDTKILDGEGLEIKKAIDKLNFNRSSGPGFTNGYNIFLNSKKINEKVTLNQVLNHELQHAFDNHIKKYYYEKKLHLKICLDNEAINEMEYRAELAGMLFSSEEDALKTYSNIVLSVVSFEKKLCDKKIHKDFMKGIYSKKLIIEREEPHNWARTKIIRELNEISQKEYLFDRLFDITITGIDIEGMKEKCKKLLNAAYEKLMGKSYDQIMIELKEYEKVLKALKKKVLV